MIKTLFLAVALVLVASVQGNRRAIAVLSGPSGTVHGNVTFAEEGNQIRVTGRVVGLKAGSYGFHVHEKGDLSNGCASTLSHFNPHGKQHGHPEDSNRHVGDLGNVQFDESGTANIDFLDSYLKLSGSDNILGRGLVLHEGTDDYGRSNHPDSKSTGNAGGRAACGVIGILDGQFNSAASTSALTTTLILSVAFFTLL